jgi:hypothetical protein
MIARREQDGEESRPDRNPDQRGCRHQRYRRTRHAIRADGEKARCNKSGAAPVRLLAAPRTFFSFDTALLLLTLKLELRPPDAVARHVVEPIFFTRLLARPVAPRRFGNLHTGLIAAASVRVDGHRRHQADHEGR